MDRGGSCADAAAAADLARVKEELPYEACEGAEPAFVLGLDQHMLLKEEIKTDIESDLLNNINLPQDPETNMQLVEMSENVFLLKLEDELRATPPSLYKICNICSHRFAVEFNSETTATSQENFGNQCETCKNKVTCKLKESFSQRTNQRVYEARKHKCNMCEYRCSSSKELAEHVGSHAMECPLCPAWCARAALRRHLAAHAHAADTPPADDAPVPPPPRTYAVKSVCKNKREEQQQKKLQEEKNMLDKKKQYEEEKLQEKNKLQEQRILQRQKKLQEKKILREQKKLKKLQKQKKLQEQKKLRYLKKLQKQKKRQEREKLLKQKFLQKQMQRKLREQNKLKKLEKRKKLRELKLLQQQERLQEQKHQNEPQKPFNCFVCEYRSSAGGGKHWKCNLCKNNNSGSEELRPSDTAELVPVRKDSERERSPQPAASEHHASTTAEETSTSNVPIAYTTDPVYKCNQCEYGSVTRMALVYHTKSVHGAEIDPSTLVKANDTTVENVTRKEDVFTSLDTNKEKSPIDPPQNEETSVQIYQCYMCEYKGTDRTAYCDHWKSVHYEFLRKKNMDIYRKLIDTSHPVYQCNKCEYRGVNGVAFNYHRKSVHGEILKKCKICLEIFYGAEVFKRHVKAHGPQPVKCNLCDFMTLNKFVMRLHRKGHKRDGVHECDLCQIKYKTKGGLKKHYTVTHKKRLWCRALCDVCGLRFITERILQRHLLKHNRTSTKPLVIYVRKRRNKKRNHKLPVPDKNANECLNKQEQEKQSELGQENDIEHRENNDIAQDKHHDQEPGKQSELEEQNKLEQENEQGELSELEQENEQEQGEHSEVEQEQGEQSELEQEEGEQCKLELKNEQKQGEQSQVGQENHTGKEDCICTQDANVKEKSLSDPTHKEVSSDQSYQCHMCEYKSTDATAYCKHWKSVHYEFLRKKNMDIYQKHFIHIQKQRNAYTAKDVTIERNNEPSDQSYQCYMCEYKTTDVTAYCEHWKTVHNQIVREKNMDIYRKHFIGRTQVNTKEKGRAKDVTMEHKNVSSDQCYQCYMCEYKTTDVTAYCEHWMSVHNQLVIKKNMDIYRKHFIGRTQVNTKEKGKATTAKDVTIEHKNVSSDQGYQCYMCEYKTVDSAAYCEHWISVHKELVLKKNMDIYRKQFIAGTQKNIIEQKGATTAQDPNKEKVTNPVYRCNKCEYRGVNRVAYVYHAKSVHGDILKVCKFCPEVFQEAWVLYKHRKTHVSELNKREVPEKVPELGKCKMCEFKSENGLILRRHEKRHERAGAYECDLCHFKYAATMGLKRHYREMHKKLLISVEKGGAVVTQDLEEEEVPEAASGPNNTFYEAYQCTLCEYKHTNGIAFKLHRITVHGYNVNKGRGLNRFLKKIYFKPHECKMCQERFQEASELEEHSKSHQRNDKPHKCNKCSYKTAYVTMLRRHERYHKINGPYQCNLCQLKYTKRESLELHNLRVHEKREKLQVPSLCNLCGDMKADRRELRLHILAHSKPPTKPFKCDFCSKRYKTLRLLRIHMTSVHKVKRSDRPSLAYLEKKFRHGNEDYKCDLCKYKSKELRCVVIHRKMKHKISILEQVGPRFTQTGVYY